MTPLANPRRRQHVGMWIDRDGGESKRTRGITGGRREVFPVVAFQANGCALDGMAENVNDDALDPARVTFAGSLGGGHPGINLA